MKIWTTVKLFLLLSAFFVLALVAKANAHILWQDFRLFEGRSVPTFFVMLMIFALGLLVSVVMIGMREAELLIERWNERRSAGDMSRADSLTYAGMNALMEGRLADAKRLFGEALRLHPSNTRARVRLGQALRLEGRFEEALREHEAVLDRQHDSWEGNLETARDLLALKRFDDAADHVRRALKYYPERAEDGEPLLLEIYMGAGEWNRAQDLYEHIRKHALHAGAANPHADYEFALPYRQAVSLAEKDDYKGAEKILRRLVKAHSAFIPAHVELGKVLIAQEREDEGLAAWSEGLKRTESLVFLPLMEDYFIETERPGEALETFRRIVAEAKNDILPRFLLGKLYYRFEMMDEAFEQFRAIEPRVRNSPTLHYFLGKARERRGALREAAESYKKAFRESGILNLQYVCRRCRAKTEKWDDRCEKCGAWGEAEIDFRTELSPRELGLVDAPVYSEGASA